MHPDLDAAGRMMTFIDASPSPFHACAEASARLDAAGFEEVREVDAWPAGPGKRYLRRGGSLVAWATRGGQAEHVGFRIIGAHTDSPNLRVKPNPHLARAGYQQVAVEVYGSPLLNSWVGRDLGLSGRLVVRSGAGTEVRLVRIDRPVLHLPQLAIHLDRDVNSEGLRLNPQQHLAPIAGVGPVTAGGLFPLLAAAADVAVDSILTWELMTHDLQPSRLVGMADELVSAPRIDNLCSSWAGVEALVAASTDDAAEIPVLVLFDHEEVGSTSDRGADSSLLPVVLERVSHTLGDGRDDLLRRLASSICCSADNAHATHPNYVDRHEPAHQIALNGGPVLKVNANLRYATDAASAAAFVLACEQAGVPLQRYSHRGDLPCGSTIGPVTAARLGIPTVDVGAPQLAMHSARELCGSADPGHYLAAMTAFLRPAG